MKTEDFDFYEINNILPDFREKPKKIKLNTKNKTIIVTVWRYHKEINKYITNSVVDARQWIKNHAYDLMYDYNECMIYVFINKKSYRYSYFMKKKYVEYEHIYI